MNVWFLYFGICVGKYYIVQKLHCLQLEISETDIHQNVGQNERNKCGPVSSVVVPRKQLFSTLFSTICLGFQNLWLFVLSLGHPARATVEIPRNASQTERAWDKTSCSPQGMASLRIFSLQTVLVVCYFCILLLKEMGKNIKNFWSSCWDAEKGLVLVCFSVSFLFISARGSGRNKRSLTKSGSRQLEKGASKSAVLFSQEFNVSDLIGDVEVVVGGPLNPEFFHSCFFRIELFLKETPRRVFFTMVAGLSRWWEMFW